MLLSPAGVSCIPQVNGDSGNDIELFEVPGVRGCVVANAHPELRQFAEAAVAAGNTNIALATQPCAGKCALSYVPQCCAECSNPHAGLRSNVAVLDAGLQSKHAQCLAVVCRRQRGD